jgi:hypothetical protein
VRPRLRWEDNIEMDHRQVGCGGMDWIGLAQDRNGVSGYCECVNEPSGSIKGGEFLEQPRTISCSGRTVQFHASAPDTL